MDRNTRKFSLPQRYRFCREFVPDDGHSLRPVWPVAQFDSGSRVRCTVDSLQRLRWCDSRPDDQQDVRLAYALQARAPALSWQAYRLCSLHDHGLLERRWQVEYPHHQRERLLPSHCCGRHDDTCWSDKRRDGCQFEARL